MSRIGVVFITTLIALILPLDRAAIGQQPAPTPSLQSTTINIQSPSSGQALQGMVSIIGSTAVEGYQSSELVFSYQNNPSGTWFLLEQSFQASSDSTLAEWDTTLISDGVYTLRLTVTLKDGSQNTAIVPGLRVRNYTPVETNTPAPATATATILQDVAVITPSIMSAATNIPSTATPIPANPAQLDRIEVWTGIGRGALLSIGLFAIAGLYLALRSVFRKR